MVRELNKCEIDALKEAWKRILWKYIEMTISDKIDQAFSQLENYRRIEISDELTITFDCKTTLETLFMLKDTMLRTNS